MRYIWLFSIVVFFSACGYKPTAHYAQELLGKQIYVEVSISRKDPKNSVLIKDAVNEAVITRLGGKLSLRESAKSELHVKIGSTSFTPTIYNDKGYVIAYKTKVTINIIYKIKDGESGSFSTTGEYDFPIAEDESGKTSSIISDSNRFQGIKLASLNAINEFISKIAIKGMKR